MIAGVLALLLAAGCAQTGGWGAPPPSGRRARGPGSTGSGANEALDAFEAIRRGEAREALDRFRREAAERERRGELLDAAQAHVAVLILARHLGRYQEATGAGRRALDLLAKSPRGDEKRGWRLTIYSNLGVSDAEMGDVAQARRYFEDGLTLAGALPTEAQRLQFTGVFSEHLARLARISGDSALALRYGEEAVRSLSGYLERLPPQARFIRKQQNGRRLLTSSLVDVGAIQLERGQLREAEATFSRARRVGGTVGSDPAAVGAIVGLGRLAMARKNYAEAAARFQEAEVIARRLHSVPQLIRIDAAIAQAATAQGQPAEALAAYRRALDLVESVRSELQESERRSEFLETKQGIYQGAVQSGPRPSIVAGIARLVVSMGKTSPWSTPCCRAAGGICRGRRARGDRPRRDCAQSGSPRTRHTGRAP